MMSSTENDVRRIMKVQLRFKAKSGEENVYGFYNKCWGIDLD